MNQFQFVQHPVNPLSELVFENLGEVVTDSLMIAKMFNKEHHNVLKDIKRTAEGIEQLKNNIEVIESGIDLGVVRFYETHYIHPQNKQTYIKQLLNFDAFMLVTMGYTTQKAMLVKMKYINEFNRMKELIQKQQQPISIEDAVIHSMTELKEIKSRQDHTEEEMNKMKLLVDNELWLTEQHKGAVQRKVKQRVFELKKEGYDNASYQGIYGALKRHFGVAKYDKVPRKYYQNAMRFIAGWYPPERPSALDDYIS
ncbi:TPA: ORF6C domain-containing protein [Bacillus cereus]|nr:ORF6C domain-containing protein [Bacillus cereus]